MAPAAWLILVTTIFNASTGLTSVAVTKTPQASLIGCIQGAGMWSISGVLPPGPSAAVAYCAQSSSNGRWVIIDFDKKNEPRVAGPEAKWFVWHRFEFDKDLGYKNLTKGTIKPAAAVQCWKTQQAWENTVTLTKGQAYINYCAEKKPAYWTIMEHAKDKEF